MPEASNKSGRTQTGSAALTFYAYANANPGYDFLGWSTTNETIMPESYESSSSPYTKSVTANSSASGKPTVGIVYAYFRFHEYDPFQVTFKPAVPAEAGSYTVDGDAIDADTILPAEVTTHVQNFNLVATPASSDYLFVRWYLDGAERETISTTASIVYTATNNVTVGAEFRLKKDVVIHFQPTGVDGVSYKVDNADTVSGSVVDKTYERAETKTVALTLAGSYAKQPRWWFRTTGSEEKVYWTYAKSPSRTFEGEVDVGVDFFNPEDCNLVAQVGDEPFDSLADAVKAWGPGKTLKLLADVTSTETVVVTVNDNISSQNWFLELGDHVWTANGCDAIQVYVCGGAEINQNYGLKVYANQQGGITAADRNCIKCVYDNEATRYRPRIEIHGGEYNGSYVIFYSTATASSGPNEGCSVWIYAGRDDGSAPVFNGNFALYKCPVNIYSGFFNGNSFHHYIVTSTANVSVYGGSFKNRDAMPKMNGGGGSPKIVFPDNIAIYVDAEGRYNVIPESSVAGLAYEAVSAAYNDTRFSAYMHEVDGQNRYKDFYWADADLAIPNIDKVFYRTITLCENVAASADATVSTANANPPCTLDVTAEGASYSGTVKISNSSAKFVIKGQSANVVCGVAKYVVSCAADEENKVYTYSLVSAAASVTVGSTTTYYRTLPDAISAATEAGVTEITILNGATESPDPAWVVQDGKLVYSPAAAQIGDEEFATFADAIDAAEAYKAEHGSYPTITVLNGATEQENPDWKIADGKLVHKVYIAQIGSAGYETLADAFGYVQDGETIVLLDDCETGSGFTINNPLALSTENVTLDLNGKVVTVNNNFSFGICASGVTVTNGFIVSAENNAKTTKINSYILVVGAEAADAAVSGVTLTDVAMIGGLSVGGSTSDAAIKGKATGTVIDGCEIMSGDFYAVCSQNHSDVTIMSGTYTANTANNCAGSRVLQGCFVGEDGPEGSIVVTGGEFVGKIEASNAGMVVLKGGYYSEKPDAGLIYTGYTCTTRVNADELYQVVPAATVTYTLGGGDPAGAALPDPASFKYPSGDMAEIALANPTYTSTDKSFAGWQVSGTDDVISSIPAGSTTDFTLVATWTVVKTVTVTESETSVPIKVTDEWLEANNLETASTDDIQVALDKPESNGLKAWENYVLGLNGTDPNAKVAADAAQGPVSATPITSNIEVPKVDTGFTVEYKLVSVDTNGTTVAEIDTQATPDLKADIASMTSETNVVYYKTVAVIKSTDPNKDVTVEVPSTNTIGVLKVESGATTTAVAVPWASYDGTNDISVADIVRTANLTPGDELKAYAPDGSGYKAWTLNESKEWVPVTVVGGSSETDADAFKVKRGSAVWLKRADPSQPIYLVGGVADAEKVPVALDAGTSGSPSWNLVGSSGTEPVNVAALLGENHDDKVSVPTAYVPKNYEYEDGKWGYWDSETYEHTNKNGRVSMRVHDVFVTDDNYIPAGTGFWYQNSGGEKNIDL